MLLTDTDRNLIYSPLFPSHCIPVYYYTVMYFSYLEVYYKGSVVHLALNENKTNIYHINCTIEAFRILLEDTTRTHFYFNDVIINYTINLTDLNTVNQALNILQNSINSLQNQINSFANQFNDFNNLIIELNSSISDINQTQQQILENVTSLWSSYQQLNESLVNLFNEIENLNIRSERLYVNLVINYFSHRILSPSLILEK